MYGETIAGVPIIRGEDFSGAAQSDTWLIAVISLRRIFQVLA
jgi:hypothetical protein